MGAGLRLDQYPLDLIERNLILSPVVKLVRSGSWLAICCARTMGANMIPTRGAEQKLSENPENALKPDAPAARISSQ
jgi:hypothetical protein